MTFSRPHVGMVGIISLFTGMIAPVFRGEGMSYAFPLTSMQMISYIVFLLLVIAFYLVSTRKWDSFRIVSLITLLIVGYMTYQSVIGGVQSHQGTPLTDYRWGWAFVVIGALLLLTTYCMGDISSDEDDIKEISDGIIGTIGALTLFIFSLLIIGASYHKTDAKPILTKLIGAEKIESISGVTMSPAYPHIEGLVFDRKNDRINYQVATNGGVMIHPTGAYYTGTDIKTDWVGNKFVVRGSEGIWINGQAQSGVTQSRIEHGALILENDNGSTTLITGEKSETYTGRTIRHDSIRTSDDYATTAWIEKTASGYVIVKNSKVISEPYPSIMELALSRNGSQTLALAEDHDQSLIILKDGTPSEMVRTGAILASWHSNGLHSIYVTEDSNGKHIIYDGVSIGKEFAEVREVFLENNGNGYVYFARETSESSYCLHTRYRGNLCGLTGYMNPRLSADGSTVIFAGKKENIWSIYRNTDMIVSDTGYAPQDNSGDYAYYDLTNPREYIFIERMSDGKYQVRKDGKIIPKIWNDVGLDASFGYDGKVIMSAQDESGWRIIEI